MNYWQTCRVVSAGPGHRLIMALVMICLAALPFMVLAHPDLLQQIERLDERIRTGPASADMYLNRGDLYRRHEDLQSAARDFATARQLDPNHPLLDFYEGRLFLDSGDAVSAEMHLARYLSVDKQHAKAWVLRGQANIQLAQPEQAADCFAEAIANSEHPSPDLYRLLVLSTLAIGHTQWEAAALIASSGVQRFGLEVTVLGLATDIALALDQPHQAADFLVRLPQALTRLPQWQARFTVLRCLETPAVESRKACQSEATQTLNDKVSGFMRGT